MIKPLLLFAAPIWSNASQTHLNIITILENKTLRMMCNTKQYDTNTKIHTTVQINNIKMDIIAQTKLLSTANQTLKYSEQLIFYENVNDVPLTIKQTPKPTPI